MMLDGLVALSPTRALARTHTKRQPCFRNIVTSSQPAESCRNVAAALASALRRRGGPPADAWRRGACAWAARCATWVDAGYVVNQSLGVVFMESWARDGEPCSSIGGAASALAALLDPTLGLTATSSIRWERGRPRRVLWLPRGLGLLEQSPRPDTTADFTAVVPWLHVLPCGARGGEPDDPGSSSASRRICKCGLSAGWPVKSALAPSGVTSFATKESAVC